MVLAASRLCTTSRHHSAIAVSMHTVVPMPTTCSETLIQTLCLVFRFVDDGCSNLLQMANDGGQLTRRSGYGGALTALWRLVRSLSLAVMDRAA